MAALAMNMRSFPIPAVALAALLALAGCGARDTGRPPLAGAHLGGPFTLRDEQGRPIDEHDFAGRYRALYFGYTDCPDVCPTTLQTLMQGYHAFAAADPAAARRLVPIFVTIDPERDTPAVMRDYVHAFGRELRGLSGTPAEIAAAAKRFGVYYRKQPATGGGYLMDHSSQVILYGPHGAPIALVPTERGAQAVTDSFARWVKP